MYLFHAISTRCWTRIAIATLLRCKARPVCGPKSPTSVHHSSFPSLFYTAVKSGTSANFKQAGTNFIRNANLIAVGRKMAVTCNQIAAASFARRDAPGPASKDGIFIPFPSPLCLSLSLYLFLLNTRAYKTGRFIWQHDSRYPLHPLDFLSASV